MNFFFKKIDFQIPREKLQFDEGSTIFLFFNFYQKEKIIKK